MSIKYEFTGEREIYEGLVLNRIRRISDQVVGGWLHHDGNLSHEGSCWVADEARVFSGALVHQDAQVSGNAIVKNGAEVMGRAAVSGDVVVDGNCSVGDDVVLKGQVKITDNAILLGDTEYAGTEEKGQGHIVVERLKDN